MKQKNLFSLIYILVGFISGLSIFFLFGVLVNSSLISSSYYSWYQNSSNLSHFIVGGLLFILGAFSSIFGLDLIFKKLSNFTKGFLVAISFVLIMLLILSIQDWWFLN